MALDQPVTLTFPEPVALAPSNASVVLEIVGESVRQMGGWHGLLASDGIAEILGGEWANGCFCFR